MTTSPLANPTATRELLEEFGLATKHRLGQNFLIDNHVIERICELAELAGDERVLEVGPGCGTLTLALLHAFEGEYQGIDFRLISADHLAFTPLFICK